ncbi:MAG: thiamine pyrophosphate-binding protein [Nitrospirales bacterium]|nr:thiamine pyrophosphate-binding protein [Nitrospirales bacterium]
MNGHQLLAHTLKSLGVTHVFSLSGSPIKETLPACSQLGIRVIGVRHQQAAVSMALAHNFVSGRLTAAVILSAGPAVTNAATGILVAKDNCWPLLVLGGKTSSTNPARPGTFQMLDGATLFHPLTKWAAEVNSTDKLVEYVTRGYHLAMTGQPGPVYLDVPARVLNDSPTVIEISDPEPFFIPKPDCTTLEKIAEILIQAQRPAIILGKGIRWSEPYKELRTLIETYRIPFITSPMGRGLLPDDHPLCSNAARDFLQQQADTILVLGARLNWTFRFATQFAHDVNLIHVDIAKEELSRHRPNSILIQGEIRQVLQELLPVLRQHGTMSGCLREREEWHARLQEMGAKYLQHREDLANCSGSPMSPYRLMKEIREFLPRDSICIFDGRNTMAAAQEVLPSYEPVSRFTAGSNGCMGVGIPFGIGAKVSAPHRMVMVICGDMAFGVCAMEMETAVRHNIPIIVVVANNDGPCAGQDFRTCYSPGHESATKYLARIPYEKIMEAFGGHAESADRPEHVQPALKRAAESGKPACLNVYVDPQTPFHNYLG